jgi:hypothetical protein
VDSDSFGHRPIGPHDNAAGTAPDHAKRSVVLLDHRGRAFVASATIFSRKFPTGNSALRGYGPTESQRLSEINDAIVAPMSWARMQMSSVGPHRHRTCLLAGGVEAAPTLAVILSFPSFCHFAYRHSTILSFLPLPTRARGSRTYLAPSMQ